MAGANTQQYGIKNWRIYREPIDGETVQLTYQDILDRLEPNDAGDGTKLGTFYGGLITSVTSDGNNAYNGPWYISYQKDENKISYHATRIPLITEINKYIDDISNKYVSHEQINTTGACVDAAYVSSLGIDANLNIILSSLLTAAEYIKPTYSFNICNNSGQVFGGVNGSTSNPIEVGSSCDLYVKINIYNFDSDTNNHKGVSYGFGSEYCKIKYENYYYTITERNTSYKLSQNESPNPYSFTTEGLHTISNDINFTYAQASYTYYPQLLSKSAYVYSKENWFDGGKFNINNYTIPAQYKYHYGWDNIDSKTSKWLPIVNANKQITTSNIPFTSAHTSFWIAIPKDIVNFDKTSNFEILYHTSIGDADLVSTSATVSTTEITEDESAIIFGGVPRQYILKKVDFNKTISGASSNYVKFTMKKL